MTDNIDWQGAIDAYYNGNQAVASIVKAFKLPVDKTIYKAFPSYTHADIKCEYCDDMPMESVFLNKTTSKATPNFIQRMADEPIEPVAKRYARYAITGQRRLGSGIKAMVTNEGYCVSLPVCPKCGHSPHKACSCSHCKDLTEQNKQRVVKHLIDVFNNSDVVNMPELASLDCESIFLALYVLTYGLSEENEAISLSNLSPEDRDTVLAKGIFRLNHSAIDEAVEMISVCEFDYDEKRIPYQLNHNHLQPSEALKELKRIARTCALTPDSFTDILEVWAKLALEEALSVMRHYCEVYGLPYRPGEKTVSAVQKSLNRYGLAQTACYIYHAVKRAQNKGKEERKTGRESFNKIYGFLCFWLDDPRARDYNAPPFNRGTTVLPEPRTAIVFSHTFLEWYGVNYFSTPINMQALPSLAEC